MHQRAANTGPTNASGLDYEMQSLQLPEQGHLNHAKNSKNATQRYKPNPKQLSLKR
jgi:hypothetical protein